jgi:hypothetical protein
MTIVVAVVVIAVVGYEFFVVDSLSGYTKVTLTPWSYPPCTIKFGNTSYYIVFFLIGQSVDGGPSINTPPNPFFQVTTEQTLIINQNESFRAIQGARYSFEGLQIVVDSVNVTSNLYSSVNVTSNQLVLYVKSTISSSEPIISPRATPPISPSPTPYESSPVPVPTPPYIVKWSSLSQ